MSYNENAWRNWHLPEHLHATNRAAEQMARTIRRREPTRPAFWYLSFAHPHPPLVPLQTYLDRYRPGDMNKPYVTTARAKGLSETRLIFKYPIRIALNPFVSTVGWVLPSLVSGAVIVSVVLNLPTVGPLLLNSLQSQDMYLAGAFIMLLSVLTLIGTIVSDILLAILDPRIRLE